MKKKLLSVLLAGAMVASVAAVGVVSASAEDLAPGDFGVLGEYTPTAGVQTQKLMFAMPAAWQNDTTKNEKCGGAAGLYWWTGYDTPDNVAGGHGWPGYKSVKVAEDGVDNLWAIDVPTYGNGEAGNATYIIWNNYLDGGMETDPVKNPFYDAAVQTKDTPGQYYSRTDDHETYDALFRYIYKKVFVDQGVEGADAIDLKSETFWVDMNKLAAAFLGENYDALSAEEKSYQVDLVLEDPEVTIDLPEFGTYASNFFLENLVGDAIYPREEANYLGESFVFDNMVFVVSFDPEKMQESPVSHKIGYAGDFYFYYGGGEYGSWPTKELNERMKTELGEENVVSGNFTQGEYVDPNYVPPTPTSDPNATKGTVPPAATDAGSSTSDSPNGSNSSNNSNGAIATGQFSFAIIVLVIMFAGAGVIFFARKREHE